MSSDSKMDMSLDQIIKLQKNGRGGNNRGKPARSAGGRFNNRRGGGASTSSSGPAGRRGGRIGRVNNTGRGGNRPRVNAGFRTRRAVNTPAGRRLAQNLVKRAMIQSRRQAIVRRRSALNDPIDNGNGPTRTQRLVNAVRKWKNTAHVLQNVLQQQQQRVNIRPRRGSSQRQRGVGFRVGGGRGIRRSLQNRLGWRQNDFADVVSQSVLSSPGRFRKRRGSGGAGNSTNSPFGQMQSDLLSREQARQQRLVADLLSRAMITASAGNSGRGRRGRGSIRGSPIRGNRTFGQRFDGNRSQDFGRSNFGGNGRNNSRFGRRFFNNNNDSSDFGFNNRNSQSLTLNERFGGGGNRRGPKSNAFRGGRGLRRGRFQQVY